MGIDAPRRERDEKKEGNEAPAFKTVNIEWRQTMAEENEKGPMKDKVAIREITMDDVLQRPLLRFSLLDDSGNPKWDVYHAYWDDKKGWVADGIND